MAPSSTRRTQSLLLSLVGKRFSVKSPGQVTGYSVALSGDTIKDGGPVQELD